MEFVAKPLDHLGDVAVVVGVLLATPGRLRQTVSDFGLDGFGVGLGTGLQRAGIAGRVPAEAGYGTSQAACSFVKDLAEGGAMRFLSQHVEETRPMGTVRDLLLGSDADPAAQGRIAVQFGQAVAEGVVGAARW